MLTNFFVAIIIRGLGGSAAFLMSFAITQQLPINEAGYFFLAFSFITIVSSFTVFGAHHASLRFIGAAYSNDNWANINAISISTSLIVFICSIIVSITLWFNIPIISELIWGKIEMTGILLLTIPIIVFTSFSLLYAHQLQSIGKVITSITIMSVIIPSGIAIFVGAFNLNSAISVLNLLIWVSGINFLFSIFIWLSSCKKVKPKFSNSLNLLSVSSSLWVTTVAYNVVQWGSYLIAAIWVSPEDIAILTISQRITMLVSLILVTINLVIAPHFSALYEQGDLKKLEQLTHRSVRAMIIIASPIVLILVLYPKGILSLFGDSYTAGANLLVILSLGQLINIVSGPVGYLLNMTGHEKELRNLVLLTSPIILLLSLILIYYFGILGAAIATAAGVSITSLCAFWLVLRHLRFNPLAIW